MNSPTQPAGGVLPAEAAHAALSWCAAALQAAIPFDDMESSVRIFDTGESKTINEILDFANAALAPAAPVPADPVAAWLPIASAPEGELVVVGWLDAEDSEHPERHDFDYLEDGCWTHHANNHENFFMVAPPGSHGPSETAPYTHWMKIQPLPAAPLHAEGGESHEPR